jgi:hypothetical protein
MTDFSEVINELMEPPRHKWHKTLRCKPRQHECLLGCGKMTTDQLVTYRLMDGEIQNERVFVGYCTTCQSYRKDNEFHYVAKTIRKSPFSKIKDKYN